MKTSLLTLALLAGLSGCVSYSAPRELGQSRIDYFFGDPTPEQVTIERNNWVVITKRNRVARWYQENVVAFGPADLEDAAYSVEESYARTNATLESVGMGSLQNCLDHAEGVVELLGRGEVRTLCHVQHSTGSVVWHTVAVVDGYVVDNGAVNGYRVFPERELKHYAVSCDVPQVKAN